MESSGYITINIIGLHTHVCLGSTHQLGWLFIAPSCAVLGPHINFCHALQAHVHDLESRKRAPLYQKKQEVRRGKGRFIKFIQFSGVRIYHLGGA